MKQLILIALIYIMSTLFGISYANEEFAPSNANAEFYQHITHQASNTLRSNGNGLVLPKMYMLHVNGVNTKQEDAAQNLENLKLNNQLTSSKNYLIWGLVYNPTAGPNPTDPKMPEENLLDNLIDTFAQKNKELYLHNASLEKYVDAYIVANDLQPLFDKHTDPAGYKDLTDHLRSHYLEEMDYLAKAGDNMKYVIDNFHNQVPVQYAGVLKLLSESPAEIRDYSGSPDTVLLIPHSQGNIYANHLYSYLTDIEHFDKKHIAIYGIGSAADQNVGDWPRYEKNNMTPQMDKVLPVPLTSYTTSCDDPVINGLRGYELGHEVFTIFNIFGASVSAPGVAACNVSNTYQSGHNLVNYYLAVDKLREPIVTMINYYAYILNYNQMHDIERNMLMDSGMYNRYPNNTMMIIGYSRLDADQIVSPYNVSAEGPEFGLYWDKHYDYNKNIFGFLFLQQPFLDNLLPKERALMHFVLISTGGSNNKYMRIIYETTKLVGRNPGYPVKIYPYAEPSGQYDTWLYKPQYDKQGYCSLVAYNDTPIKDPFGQIDIGVKTGEMLNNIKANLNCYYGMKQGSAWFEPFNNGYWLDGVVWR